MLKLPEGVIVGKKRGGITKCKPYYILHQMRQRCNNPQSTAYDSYGGRGITICDEWMKDTWAFVLWSYANGFEDGLEIDRIDNDKGYCPENCRFTTKIENCNNRRKTRIITAWGETKRAFDWKDDPRCAVSVSSFLGRIARGWRPEEAIGTPSVQTGGKRNTVRRPRGDDYSGFGERKSIAEWSRDERCLVPRSTLATRLKRGWDVENAMITAPKKQPFGFSGEIIRRK